MYSLIVSYNLHESVLPVHILEKLVALMKWSFNGQSCTFCYNYFGPHCYNLLVSDNWTVVNFGLVSVSYARVSFLTLMSS